MELEKHTQKTTNDEVLWTLNGASRNEKSEITMDADELIETYNLIMKELADIGIVNIGSH